MREQISIKNRVKRIQRYIFQIIDWFVHPCIVDPEAFRQARLGIIFSIILVFAAILHAVITVFIGAKIAFIILAGAIILEICNLFFLRMTGSFFLSGIFLSVILFSTLFSVNFFWGGWHSPGLVWLAFVSVIGTNLSGRKTGYVWLGISLIGVLFFYLLDMYGYVFPNELKARSISDIQLLMLIGTLTITWIFILLYEIFKDYMVHIHKMAKEEIREKAQTFNTILSASPFGICLLKNRTVAWGNEALRQIFGLDPGEGLGMEARSFYADDAEYERVTKVLYGERLEPGIRTVDARMKRKNGDVFDSCIILNPIDPLDMSRGNIVAIMDITERKQAEAEIKRLNKQLEERVFDRTLKLRNAREEIIQKEHKSELADLTTGTLHNVRNILNSVKVSTEVLYRIFSEGSIKGLRQATMLLEENKENIEEFILINPKGKKLIEYYLKIGEIYNAEEAESLKHLKRLQQKVYAIENIVTTQQGYAGRSVTEDVFLEALIEDALVMHADSFESHQIEVIREFSETPKVMAIKTKVMHILINLIKNAKEAMKDTPMSDRKLVLTTGMTHETVFIKVKDTGCGITPEDRKKIFQHGFTTKEDGHGFGLHSCYKYMKEMGGEMNVESDGQGKGATFFLNFSLGPVSNHSPQ